MTLVSRVSLFFLAALAVCLAGYSLMSYLLIRHHLEGQFDQQLASTLHALVAAVEVEDDSVKWQPTEHSIPFGDEPAPDEVRWVIFDRHGHLVDKSLNLQATPLDQRLLKDAWQLVDENQDADAFPPWRMLRQRLVAPHPLPESEFEADEFTELQVIVARNTTVLQADLWRLAALVWLLPFGLWVIAAFAGRSYCRRALAPLGAMALRAQSMTQADFRLRMPAPQSRDELGELSAAFNGLLDQLQQAFETQQRFTGDAAHQLRTPLTVLRGEIDVALRRPRTADEYRRVLDTLKSQTEHLQQIVETLLSLARSQGTPEKLELAPIDFADWLPQYLTRWKSEPRAADLLSEIDPDVVAPTSPTLLSQALDNLISNAAKYSPPGTPILVQARRLANGVEVSVEDSGPGIAEADRQSIFEPFFRTQQARQSGTEGIGLGLPMVAAIAKALGGRVDYEPRSPRGSRFTIQLPPRDTISP